MLEIYQLEELIALADLGTISKAADKIGVSQPAMSRAMKNLEDELAVPIFKRSKNTIELTETGKIAAAYSRKVIEDIKTLKEAVIRADRSSRTILVGSVAPAPLWKATSALSSIFPDMTIAGEIKDEKALTSGLTEGLYQFIITTAPVEEKSIHSLRISEEKLFFSLSKKHKLSKKTELSLSDLDGENMILFKNIGIWKNVLAKMPHTKFFIQEDITAFEELVNNSTLPAFATNMTKERYSDRIFIPVTDKEAQITFYVNSKNKDSSVLSKLI